MEPKEIERLAVAHCNAVFAKLGSRNKINAYCMHAGKWWVAEPNNWNYGPFNFCSLAATDDHPVVAAGARAMERVFAVKPDLTREGGSIPVTLTLQVGAELPRNTD